MKKVKNVLTIMFLVMILTIGCAAIASAETVNSGDCGDNITWSLNGEGVLSLIGTGSMYDYNTPNDRYSAAPWYREAYNIVSVEMSEGITSIGDYAFYDCKNMMTITIPDGLKSFGERCFESSGIKSIYIPSSVNKFGESAFWRCNNLKKVTIESLESYLMIPNTYFLSSNPLSNGADLYIGDNKVTDLNIPYGVTEIYSGRFFGCSSIDRVNIPESVTKIGSSAFGRCPLREFYAPHIGKAFDFNWMRDEDTGYFAVGQTDCSESKATIWWTKVPNAVKYEISIAGWDNKVIKTITNPDVTTATINKSDLSGADRVYVSIYYDDGVSPGYQKVARRFSLKFKVENPTIKKISSSQKVIYAEWNRLKDAKGYEVMVSSTKNFKSGTTATHKITDGKDTSIKIKKYTDKKKLVKGKKYYVKVRAYMYIYNGYGKIEKTIYGPWSGKKEIICK